jgi:hypothetical protein
MEEKNSFFGDARAQLALARARSKVASISAEGEFESQRNKNIVFILDAMRGHADEWDTYCAINIKWIGVQFINDLDTKESIDSNYLDNLFATCFRFVFELFLSIKNDLSMEFEQVRRFAINHIDRFSPESKLQIDFALRDMPIAILKQLLNSDQINSLKDLTATFEVAKKKTDEWNNDLENREKRVVELRENLDRYESAFNFVGLYQGFDGLAKTKEKERDDILLWLKLLGVGIVIPFSLELVLVWQNLNELEKLKTGLLISLLPSFAIGGLLIFYFRILLHNFNAVKSQLLQIELRKTLCRFIQSYVDYAEKMKGKNADSLTRFESVIFSGIVSSEEKLPSTFDGVEQIGNFISAIRKQA